MTGTYDRGSLVYDRVVPTSACGPATSSPSARPGHAGLVTHRIHAMTPVRRPARASAPRATPTASADAWASHAAAPRSRRASPSTFPTSASASPRSASAACACSSSGSPRCSSPCRALAGLWRDADPGRAAARRHDPARRHCSPPSWRPPLRCRAPQATFTASTTQHRQLVRDRREVRADGHADRAGRRRRPTTRRRPSAAPPATRPATTRPSPQDLQRLDRHRTAVQTLTADAHGHDVDDDGHGARPGHLHRVRPRRPTPPATPARAAPTPSRSTRPRPTATTIAATNKPGGTAGKIERRHHHLHLLRADHAGARCGAAGTARARASTSGSPAAARPTRSRSLTADRRDVDQARQRARPTRNYVSAHHDLQRRRWRARPTAPRSWSRSARPPTCGVGRSPAEEHDAGRPTRHHRPRRQRSHDARAYTETDTDVDF